MAQALLEPVDLNRKRILEDKGKECHLVENLFLKLKNNRCFATRYEKKALYFWAVVCLACILL